MALISTCTSFSIPKGPDAPLPLALVFPSLIGGSLAAMQSPHVQHRSLVSAKGGGSSAFPTLLPAQEESNGSKDGCRQLWIALYINRDTLLSNLFSKTLRETLLFW